MSSPTALALTLDATEYSRFEPEHSTVTATITATGGVGTDVTVAIYKARRARDVRVSYKTFTIPAEGFGDCTFSLPALLNDAEVPLMRRGGYYIRATSVFLTGTAAASSTTTVVNWTGGGLSVNGHIGRLLRWTNAGGAQEWRPITANAAGTVTVLPAFSLAPATGDALEIITYGDSPDFLVSLFTVDRFKRDRLFGIDMSNEASLSVKEQPVIITGVTVTEVSPTHPMAWTTLTYTGPVGELVLGGSATAGSTTTVVNWSGGGLVVNAHAGEYLTWSTESKLVVSNTASAITLASAFSAAPVSGDKLEFNHNSGQRSLSWCGGPRKFITAGTSTYILRRGNNPKDVAYIKVKVAFASLPVSATLAEDLLVVNEPMTDATIRAFIDRAISWFEDEAVLVYLEPTRCITNIPAASVVAVVGTDIPAFVNADWDAVVAPLSYRKPSKNYVAFTCPQRPVLYYETLYAQIANKTVVAAVPPDWVQVAHVSGWTEILPYNLNNISTYQGMWWYTWFPPDTIPNMWHYDVLAGFRVTPPVLLDLVQVQAVIQILTAAAQSRGAVSSRQLSRDGVMERIDFTTSAMYNIFSASIVDLNRWMKENLPRIIGKYRGPQIDAM